MAEIKELYYKKADAERAAKEFMKLWGGWWDKTWVDETTDFSFEDERMQGMQWSGELAAINVYGCRNGMGAVFAWWEE